MDWLLLVVGTILVVECFLRFPVIRQVSKLTGLLGKITRVLKSSSISDHWKEQILPVYAGKLFVLSITLFALILFCLLPILAALVAANYLSLELSRLLLSWIGILASCAVAIVYLFARKRVLSV